MRTIRNLAALALFVALPTPADDVADIPDAERVLCAGFGCGRDAERTGRRDAGRVAPAISSSRRTELRVRRSDVRVARARGMLSCMLALLLAAAIPAAADAPPALESRATTNPVLLDGLCSDAEWRGATRIALDATHELQLMHDDQFAYACITGPADEHITLDLYLLGSRGDPPLNLHASAQVGERMRGAHGWPPYEWWNHRDWYSPAVPFKGMEGEGDERRPQFASGRPRELQIRRARFGDGPWRAMLAVGGRRAADGSWQPLVYPPGAKDDAPDGWAAWSFRASARCPRASRDRNARARDGERDCAPATAR